MERRRSARIVSEHVDVRRGWDWSLGLRVMYKEFLCLLNTLQRLEHGLGAVATPERDIDSSH